MQVWSRFEGYPGDGSYLEFHKMRWPGGLKLWRVSGPDVDLGEKEPYDPGVALDRARGHADHFADLLGGIASAESQRRDGVIVAPFDTELFGHWWYEGPDFLGAVYRALRGRPAVRPSTGSQHLARHPSRAAVRMPSGSWGANGDFIDVAQRADRVDLGTALAARGAVLGRGPEGARLGGEPLHPRAGRTRAAARAVVGLAVHHLDRRGGGLRASAGSASTAATPRSWSRRWSTARRRRSSAAGAARRCSRSGMRSSPTWCPRSRRRSPAPALSSSGSPWFPSGSRSACTSTNPSATSITSSPSTSRTCTARCSTRSPTAEFLPVVLHLSGPLLEWLELPRARLPRPARPAGRRRQGRDPARRVLRAGAGRRCRAQDRVEQIGWLREAVQRALRRGRARASGSPSGSGSPSSPPTWPTRACATRWWTTATSWSPASPPSSSTRRTGPRATAGACALFPIDERLRYLIPFRPPEETADYLRELRAAGHQLAVLADDGEKFGGWPGTKEWVYGKGWLDRFMATIGGLVGARARSCSAGCDDALDAVPSGGLAYLPTASYREMEGWSLPPDAALRLARLEHELGEGARQRPRGRAGPGRALAQFPGQVLRNRTGCTRR